MASAHGESISKTRTASTPRATVGITRPLATLRASTNRTTRRSSLHSTMGALDDPTIAARHEWWQQNITAHLPRLLDELVTCDALGIGDGRVAPPNTYGVYL